MWCYVLWWPLVSKAAAEVDFLSFFVSFIYLSLCDFVPSVPFGTCKMYELLITAKGSISERMWKITEKYKLKRLLGEWGVVLMLCSEFSSADLFHFCFTFWCVFKKNHTFGIACITDAAKLWLIYSGSSLFNWRAFLTGFIHCIMKSRGLIFAFVFSAL